MDKELLMDAVGMLDDELIGNYLRMRERLQEKAAKRKTTIWKRGSLVAACLAAVMLVTYGISYIPKEYDTGYQPPYTSQHTAVIKIDFWIYYVNDLGFLQRERVRMYKSRWFQVWKEKNDIGEDVEIFESEVVGNIPIYNKNGGLEGGSKGDYYIWTLTISKNLTKYDHYEKLVKSLIKTMNSFSNADEIRLILY